MNWLRAILALAGLHESCLAHETESLLDYVQRRHKATVDSIFAVSCELKVTEEYSDGRVSSSPTRQYWRDRDSYRCKWREGNQLMDTLIGNQRVRTLQRDTGSSAAYGSIKSEGALPLGVSDPWVNAMFVFFGEGGIQTQPVPFEELVRRFKVRRTERFQDGVHERIVVELAVGPSVREYWFDSRQNYLVTKFVAASGDSSAVREVVSFQEPSPGTWFPERIVLKSYKGATLFSTRTAVFSKISVNRPISPQMMRLDFPPKTVVDDLVQGKKFITDANGLIAGPGSDLPGPPLPALPSGNIIRRTESKSEPLHWTSLVLPVSLCVLFTGAALWLVNRWKLRARSFGETTSST